MCRFKILQDPRYLSIYLFPNILHLIRMITLSECHLGLSLRGKCEIDKRQKLLSLLEI
jgi:hypothetical protein